MYRRMMSSTMGSHPRSSIAMELSRIAPDAFPPKTVIGVYWINDDIDLGGASTLPAGTSGSRHYSRSMRGSTR
jgi:hypothetical protein